MYPLKKLSEICDIIGGGTPSKSNASFYEGVILWATVRDMKSEIIEDTECKISPEAVKGSSTHIIPAGNVIIATRVGLGKVCMNKFDTAINQDLRGIIPKDSKILSTRYLFFWLKSITDIIINEGTGATVQGVKLPFIQSLQIPLPPLSTQLDIVARLDSAMAEIDRLRIETESALASTRELWESTLESVFASEGNDWNNTKLQNHIELILGFAFKSKNYSESEDDILLLRGDNIMQGYIRYEDIKRWKRAEYNEYRKYQLQENDILLAMDRPWTKAGLKCAKLGKEYLPALLVQRAACLRNKEDLDNTFLYYIVKSRRFLSHLLGVQTGIGVPHISGSQILDFSFQIPPLPEQSRIVAHLDAVRAEMEQLEGFYSEKLASLDELRRSVLQEAFLS